MLLSDWLRLFVVVSGVEGGEEEGRERRDGGSNDVQFG